ncbi:hypothetical protein L0666_09870 [Octadecabacter sp. CECT 8868]|uniref:hypothetical protein n=1 Tax=Octadecabacter algicola TaxID=2909342 RepID=UPI001F31F13C|nr:hypothetical protein [Octadecabacter algicola]MCF2905297.1 hypothetical protein [Octadecabacter algicola]
MTSATIHRQSDEVRTLIEERLRVKGRTLEKALAKAGRLLPKWAQREGTYLVHAEQYLGHPKLRLMIDEAKVAKAHQTLVEHLKSIDPKERRKTRLLQLAGAVSFNLIIVLGAFIFYMWYRGYL